MKNLRQEFVHAQEEVKRIKSIPLVIGQFLEAVDHNSAIVGSTTGQNHYVKMLSTIDRELLKPSASIALHKHSNALVDILPPESDSSITMLSDTERPNVSYSDIGGLDIQKQEIREAVELPLTQFDLYKSMVSTHQEVFFYMVLLVAVKRCWQKPLHIILLPVLSES